MRNVIVIAALAVVGLCAQGQQDSAPPSSNVRQSLDDAWWTGPMLAPSAATLPRVGAPAQRTASRLIDFLHAGADDDSRQDQAGSAFAFEQSRTR